MVDRQKVMKGLKACSDNRGECRKCPYNDYNNIIKCISDLTKDALELLREDEQTIESLQNTINKLTKSIAE